VLKRSDMYAKYKNHVDPQSAFEILGERMKQYHDEAPEEKKSTSRKKEKSTFDQVIGSPVARQVGRELVRGVFGVLFGTTTRRRSSRRSIF